LEFSEEGLTLYAQGTPRNGRKNLGGGFIRGNPSDTLADDWRTIFFS
jgi:hypothetical protein